MLDETLGFRPHVPPTLTKVLVGNFYQPSVHWVVSRCRQGGTRPKGFLVSITAHYCTTRTLTKVSNGCGRLWVQLRALLTLTKIEQ